MRKFLVIAATLISLVALLPLAGILADPFANHPFTPMFFDPLLLVCPDYVEALHWHDLSGGSVQPLRPECSFQIPPARQAWVKNAVRQLQPPSPEHVWSVRIKQLGVSDQRIQFELCGGKGCFGTIYEVRNGVVTPLKSRVDETEMGVIILFIFLLLLIPWALAQAAIRRIVPRLFPSLANQT